MELVFPTWISFFLERDCSSCLGLLFLACSRVCSSFSKLWNCVKRMIASSASSNGCAAVLAILSPVATGTVVQSAIVVVRLTF